MIDPVYAVGVNETDAYGQPRVYAGIVDMGADEVNFAIESITPAVAGQDNTVVIRGTWPGGFVTLAGSRNLGGPTILQYAMLDLDPPLRVDGVQADADDVATFQSFIPSANSGATVYLQAVDEQTCGVTPVVGVTFR